MYTPNAQRLDFVTSISNQRLGREKIFSAAKQYNGVPPWRERPSEWKDFDQSDTALLGIVGVTTTIVTYIVPLGRDGVIEGFHVEYTASIPDNGDLLFRMFNNGRPVQEYNNIKTNLGTTQIPRPCRIRVYSGNVITLVVEHVANGTLTDKLVSGSLKGYTYSISET